MKNRRRDSFTLIELLIVIGIIAILGVIVVLTINPVELLRQARDAKRLSEISTLHRAINLYEVDVPGTTPGLPNTIYLSLPDDVSATCASHPALPTPPPGWQYNCVTEANLRNANGTGWIPVDFTALSTGAPLAALPVDPQNDAATGLYYSYVAGGSYVLTAILESEKHLKGSGLDDGGTDPSRIELGSNLELWTSASGLVGYWKFDEGGGATATDASGNGNNGTLTLMDPATDWISGKAGGALDFDGADDYVNFGADNFGVTNEITVSAWFKLDNVSGTHMIAAKRIEPWPSASALFLLYAFKDQLVFRVYTSAAITEFSDVGAVSAGVWQHAVGTYDGTAVRVYVDAVMKSDPPATSGPLSTNSYSTLVGAQAFSGGKTDYFDGAIDEVRIYSRALHAAEIQTLYKAQK